VADKQGMRPQIVQRPGKEVEAISTARAVFQRCQFDEAPLGKRCRRHFHRRAGDAVRSDLSVREIIDEAADEIGSYEPLPGHRSQVEAMAGYGVSEADIAKVLDVDPETLRLHYCRELEASSVKTNAKVAENLYRKATGDGREAVTAAIFWLKTRARWKETSVHELGGASELPPIGITEIRRIIVDPKHGIDEQDC